MNEINPIYQGEAAIIIGTGPSLSDEQLKIAINAQIYGRARLFGCNNAYQVAILDVHLACNWQWWDKYFEDIKSHSCDKWTPRKESADKYEGVNYIEERWAGGLSINPSYIHAHHGSGPQIVNLATLYGCTKLLLIGWDMRFPGKISDHEYTGKRHFHNETDLTSKHWPRTGPNGELAGLIKEMETIKPADYGIEIINCTPNSAMTCFPMGNLEDCL